MKLNFDGRITLVVESVDMRSGYHRLALRAKALFDIDVATGREMVVFISRRRGLCKVIWSDEHGTFVLARRLHAGRFESFLAEAQNGGIRNFTPEDLERFMDGAWTQEK